MPPGKNWAVTQLGDGTSLELQIDLPSNTEIEVAIPGTGVTAKVTLKTPKTVSYEISQFTATWAVNEIPNAQCMLAIGRDVRELIKAEIHRTAKSLRQMRKARVIFKPVGEYDPGGTKWPAEFVIFDGYFMGMAYNKVNGKINVIANLKHWLIDLACSSCLTQNSHPINPAHLTAVAVMAAIDEEGGSESHYISNQPGIQLIRDHVTDDLWGAIKRLFCGLTNFPVSIGASEEEGACGGTGNAVINARARRALARIEGPAFTTVGRGEQAKQVEDEGCSLDYKYGVPLRLDLLNVQDAEDSVAKAITEASIESYANTTFWDKLVGEYCPSFNVAVIPAVDYALVIADCPAFNGGPWRTIETGEYDSFQMQADLERPLRAVGVVIQYGSGMGVPEGSGAEPPPQPVVGGCFAADVDDPDDGIIQYVAAPRWLQCLVNHEPYARGTTGLGDDEPSRTETTPKARGGVVPPPTGDLVADVNKLLDQYAQSVFVANMLRGRSGVVGGKLRFDIAPGSIVKVKGSEERFLAGEDELATDMVGCVNRVTVAINAEGPIAGTTFVLSHLRTDAENGESRTGVDAHPLFQMAIHGNGSHGSPLVAGHEDLTGGIPALEPEEPLRAPIVPLEPLQFVGN